MEFPVMKMELITIELSWSMWLTKQSTKMMDKIHIVVCFFSSYTTIIKNTSIFFILINVISKHIY